MTKIGGILGDVLVGIESIDLLFEVFDLVLMVDKWSFEVNISSFDEVDFDGKGGSFIR